MGQGFSVIVPVLHEGDTINGTIDSLRSIDGGEALEIIVVDCAGDTLAAIERDDIVRSHAGRGRSVQMNQGARVAGGDVLVFLHADTKLPGDALISIREALSDPEVVGGAFDLVFDPSNLFLRLIEILNIPRVRITRVPYGDHAIFMRKDVFLGIGGYREIGFMEDVELMRRLRKDNMPIRILKGPVRTSPRRFRDDGYLKHSIRFFLMHLRYWLGGDPDRMGNSYYLESEG